jgi:ribosomal protein S27AE
MARIKTANLFLGKQMDNTSYKHSDEFFCRKCGTGVVFGFGSENPRKYCIRCNLSLTEWMIIKRNKENNHVTTKRINNN